MTEPEYPWTRRDTESSQAYDAFRAYMLLGGERSVQAAADKIGKARSLLGRWSGTHEWHSRAVAYDSYLMTAAVDGVTDAFTQVRNRHLEVAAKLLDHLALSMAGWKPDQDPSIRWTTAFTAAAKVQQTALTLKETTSKTDDEAVERILSVIEKAQK